MIEEHDALAEIPVVQSCYIVQQYFSNLQHPQFFPWRMGWFGCVSCWFNAEKYRPPPQNSFFNSKLRIFLSHTQMLQSEKEGHPKFRGCSSSGRILQTWEHYLPFGTLSDGNGKFLIFHHGWFLLFSNSTRVTNSQWSLQCLIKPWWWVSRRVATPGKIGHEWLILVLKHPFRETIHVIPALHVIKTPRNLGEMLWGMRIGIPKHGLLEQNHFISQGCTLRQINRLESPGC